MATTRLIHITPELPPTVGGIADYTAILSQRLMEVSNGAVEPVLLRAGKASDTEPDVDFRIVDHGRSYSAGALSTTIEQLTSETSGPAVVLLQYSGYGYAPRGAPLWLLRALQQVCGGEGVPLITMFHELYATGPPWTGAFWVSPMQRYVAAQLGKLSRAILTNRVDSANWLRGYVASGTPVRVQSVFSNVGEPENIPSWRERQPYAVVFGGKSMKQRLYDRLQPCHINELQGIGIYQIVDVGSPGAAPETIHGLPIDERGIQPVEAISALLRKARAGLLHYPVDYLTKSGIWSGYVAHGVPSIVISPPRCTRIIREGTHFTRWDPVSPPRSLSVDNFKKSHVHDWYRQHAHSTIAAKQFMEAISQVVHICSKQR